LRRPFRLDPDFGVGGIARTPLPPAYDNEPFKEIAAVPGGGVLARVGYFSSGDINRYGPDGALLGEETREEAVVLQPPEAVTVEGIRLVGVGLPDEAHSAVTRYAPGGALDTSFGSGGTSEGLPFSVEAVAALPPARCWRRALGSTRGAVPKRRPSIRSSSRGSAPTARSTRASDKAESSSSGVKRR